MNLQEEKQLIADIKSDPTRFGILFDLYYPLIFNYALHRVHLYDDAREIASETFLKAFIHISSFKYRGISISYWIYRIATNEIQQYYRKRKRSYTSLDQLIDSTVWDTADPQTTETEKAAYENELLKSSDFSFIREKIQLLSSKYQDVLTLRYFESKSVKEISLILNKKEGTIKSLMSRGIEKLKQLIKKVR